MTICLVIFYFFLAVWRLKWHGLVYKMTYTWFAKKVDTCVQYQWNRSFGISLYSRCCCPLRHCICKYSWIISKRKRTFSRAFSEIGPSSERYVIDFRTKENLACHGCKLAKWLISHSGYLAKIHVHAWVFLPYHYLDTFFITFCQMALTEGYFKGAWPQIEFNRSIVFVRIN